MQGFNRRMWNLMMLCFIMCKPWFRALQRWTGRSASLSRLGWFAHADNVITIPLRMAFHEFYEEEENQVGLVSTSA